MNVLDIPRIPQSFRYVSITIDPEVLKAKLKIPPREAFMLSVLLREYQTHWLEFHTSAARQHLMVLRRSLTKIFGDKCIVSLGAGNYTILDSHKELIQEYVNGTRN